MTPTLTAPKEVLEAAKMAELLRSPETEAAKRFVQHLTQATVEFEAQTKPRTRRRKQKDQENFEKAIGAFASDLIHSATNDESEGFMYRPNDKVELSDTFVSSHYLGQLVGFWEGMGLLEKTGFFQAKDDFDGLADIVFMSRARRYRATPLLLQMADDFRLYPETIKDHFPKQTHLIRTVTVRDERYSKKGNRQQSQTVKIKGPEYDRQTKLVDELNDFYSKQSFNLDDQPRLYRLFNRGNYRDFNFNMGGRLYCASDDNWQSIDSNARSLIKINGQETVELDISASHMAVLHGITRMPLDTTVDPYDLEGVERDVVKNVFSAWCGLGRYPRRWPKKFKEEYAQRKGRELNQVYKLKSVVSALRERHPALSNIKSGALDWSKLQFEESECLLSVMLDMQRNFEVPALPVFDSLIVPEKYSGLTTEILKSSYQDRFGIRPQVRCK